MVPADAIRLASRLKAAYPRMTLDEPEMELLVRELALLSDALILNQAVDRIIRTSERFPSIAEVRAQYRACNEVARRPALPGGARPADMPEWIQVWFWQIGRTRTERQTRNTTSRQAIVDRPPVPMRDFPQFVRPGADAYTQDEYRALRAEWFAAGSPRASSVAELIGGVA